MVMSRTKATEASIHAVSPELILSKPTRAGSVGAGCAAGACVAAAGGASAGAAPAAVAGASSPRTADSGSISKTRQTRRNSLVFNVNPLWLNCAGASFTRANPHGLHEVEDENLAVAHGSGSRRLDDCL